MDSERVRREGTQPAAAEAAAAAAAAPAKGAAQARALPGPAQASKPLEVRARRDRAEVDCMVVRGGETRSLALPGK